jgi:hypothetical protein
MFILSRFQNRRQKTHVIRRNDDRNVIGAKYGRSRSIYQGLSASEIRLILPAATTLVIKIVALLRGPPAECHEQTLTTSDFADISLQSCMMGEPQLADRMKEHPAESLAGWRCEIGKREGREPTRLPANSPV